MPEFHTSPRRPRLTVKNKCTLHECDEPKNRGQAPLSSLEVLSFENLALTKSSIAIASSEQINCNIFISFLNRKLMTSCLDMFINLKDSTSFC